MVLPPVLEVEGSEEVVERVVTVKGLREPGTVVESGSTEGEDILGKPGVDNDPRQKRITAWMMNSHDENVDESIRGG
jgi:hypothetical protein